jgi:hypothetical protein
MHLVCKKMKYAIAGVFMGPSAGAGSSRGCVAHLGMVQAGAGGVFGS